MLERAKKQGIGRKSVADVMKVAEEDLKAISDFLADKPFLHGDRMSTVSSLVLSRCTANWFSHICCIFRSTVQRSATSVKCCAFLTRSLRRSSSKKSVRTSLLSHSASRKSAGRTGIKSLSINRLTYKRLTPIPFLGLICSLVRDRCECKVIEKVTAQIEVS